MIKHIGLSMALCVMIMGTGCAGTDTTPKNTVSDVTGGTVITIEDFSFSPKTITVSPGEVVTVVNKDIAVLQFGGGCQGCGMVDTTLKDGVEKTLLEQLPQLKGVKDVTDHTFTENAYFP